MPDTTSPTRRSHMIRRTEPSQLCFAGQGYCFALVHFGADEDAQHLTVCLDRYLRQLDCQYDQHWVISALLHVDSRRGSEHGARFLVPGSLWDQWNEAQPRSSSPSRFMDDLCAFANRQRSQWSYRLGVPGMNLNKRASAYGPMCTAVYS
ncbi:DUF6000 family protein [Kitasatospora griseola]|uniref:DUF6000 family protein n=1 Tax=Kitasatospora griseola TaxID=2064 RepID=UPI003420C463